MRRSKQARQQAIRTLVTTQHIQRQDDLVRLLNAEGWNVTQATVSRDISELQLVKVPLAEGGFTYAIIENEGDVDQLSRILEESTTEVVSQENMVMIKVTPGSGPALKMALEEANFLEIFGLIGDDAGVLIILRTEYDGDEFAQMLVKTR